MSNLIATFDDDNSVKGTVKFHQCVDDEKHTWIYFDLYNLSPNSTHAIHIHEWGDKSGGCKTLGPHWNPYNKSHGSIMINPIERHVGDLINNFKTDNQGQYKGYYKDNLIRVRGCYSVLGRSVVIHKGIDDLGLGDNVESLKTGNAGDRLSCAIIGYMKK